MAALRKWSAVALVVAAALLASCNGAGTGGNASPTSILNVTPTLADDAGRTPTPSGQDLPVLAPEDLAAKLLGGDQPFAELPSSYGVDITSLDKNVAGLPKAVNAVNYRLNGPDAGDSVVFAIHNDVNDAKDDYGTTTAGKPIRPDQVQGLGFPAKSLSYGGANGGGYTTIYVQAGQTVIIATSMLAVEAPSGNFDHAFELAQAGLSHLIAATNR